MQHRQLTGTSRSGGLAPAKEGRRYAVALLVTLAVILSGCAVQQNSSGSVIVGSQGTRLGENLGDFLSQSAPNSTLVLQQSPWGENVEVKADASYYAASGRTCRHLQIMGLQRSDIRSAVACKTAGSSWVSQRLVTQVHEGRTAQ